MITFATLLGSLVFCGSAPLTDTSDVERKVVRLEEAWRVAQSKDDKAAFERLLAPDLTFIGTSGSLRTKAEYVASRKGSWIPRASTFTVSELRVQFYGQIARVTGRETTTGAGVNATARFTHIWILRRGEWRLLAIQRTAIAPPA